MAVNVGSAVAYLTLDATGFSKGLTGAINEIGSFDKKVAGFQKKIGNIGSSMTKAITLPAVGAATAITGIVSAFGWERLKGVDAAESQLKGLGYTAKDVGRISEQVLKAVQGTTMTMAEGTSVAAGALAAGVKEGADLERYIRQVGNAAVGANRPIADMAQIFNRVQGSGKLMTMELNMIEQGMPGFAMAMAESLGVPQAEFRKMVTAGQVSSEQFLDVMEGFAGEMSEAYANSWEGMVSNTKAWIGIIGESLLSGVFKQSKESVGEFMEYLKSDDVQAWAAEAGVAVGEAFIKVVEAVKSAIEWWTGLSDTTKSVIKTLALLVVAIGPVLTIISKLIGIVTTAGKIFGVLKGAAVVLGGALGAITAPVAIAIAAIAAIIAIGVLLYKNWDTIKEKAGEIWKKIEDIFSKTLKKIQDVFKKALDGIKSFFKKWGDELLLVAIGPVGWLVLLGRKIAENWDTIKTKTVEVWNNIKAAIIKPIESAKQTVLGIIESIKDAFARMKITIPKPKLPHVDVNWKSVGVGDAKINIPTFRLNWYKEGGIFNNPAVIGVGESGTEVVAPLDKLAKMIEDGVGRAMSRDTSPGGFNRPIELIVNLDGRVVSRALYNLQEDDARGRGLATAW